MRSTLAFSVLLFSIGVQAFEAPVHSFSNEENSLMINHNAFAAQFEQNGLELLNSQGLFSFSLIDETDVRAFAEYEEAGYLIFSSDFSFESKVAKQTMAENLPEGVKLVLFVYTENPKVHQRIKKDFAEVIDPSRVTLVYMPRADRGFWARDGVPVPVFRTTREVPLQDYFTVVDAAYPRFEQDLRFSQLFDAKLTEYNYYFEGGNFIANSKNECLIVNKVATAKIPDRIFEEHYGCKVLVRLPHVKGIGHADESVKFIDDKTVLTDEKSYVETLEKQGYDVQLLPRPNRKYETYVNSLIINGTVFVPIFEEEGDQEALDVYQKMGFEKVIGINSETLSNDGLGSLHCITMTYPPVEMSQLLETLGAKLLSTID